MRPSALPRNPSSPLLPFRPHLATLTLALPARHCRPPQVFNILCEHPETVAAYLVPRARSVVARGDAGTAIRYLTPARVLAKLAAAPLRAGRYFDRDGEA